MEYNDDVKLIVNRVALNEDDNEIREIVEKATGNEYNSYAEVIREDFKELYILPPDEDLSASEVLKLILKDLGALEEIEFSASEGADVDYPQEIVGLKMYGITDEKENVEIDLSNFTIPLDELLTLKGGRKFTDESEIGSSDGMRFTSHVDEDSEMFIALSDYAEEYELDMDEIAERLDEIAENYTYVPERLDDVE